MNEGKEMINGMTVEERLEILEKELKRLQVERELEEMEVAESTRKEDAFDGSVKCVLGSNGVFTQGKIYEVVDGEIHTDVGVVLPRGEGNRFRGVNELNSYTFSKFVKVEDQREKWKKILSLPMGENDAAAKTVGEYFSELLVRLWREGEGFSAKRPFGNEEWDLPVYEAMIDGGYDIGVVEDDVAMGIEYETADEMLEKAIRAAFGLEKENE